MKSKNSFQQNPFKNILIRYKPVLLLLLLCGFNYKVFRIWNKYKIVANLFCVSLIILITVSSFYCCENIKNSLQDWALIEYIFSVAILIIYDSKLTKFSIQLFKIDSLLRVTMKFYNKGKIRVIFLIFIVWLVRLSFMVIYCLIYSCFTNFVFFALSLFACFALDVNRIWRFLLLEIIRNRFSLLRQRLEEQPECHYLNSNEVSNKKDNKKNHIKICNNLYKRILDTVEVIAPEFHASMIVSIICSLPKLVSNFYHILLVLEKHEPIQSIGFVIIHISQTCFLLFSPCIVLELHCLEVDKIRIRLINRLLEETDPKIREDLLLFLQYTEVRKYHCKIWRFIPLNISLPIEIANICISTVIVIINITHLYG